MNNGDKIKENDEPKDIEILTFLPLASSIQLEQVELFLKENSKNLSILASELSRIGGNNVSVITKRIMYRTFSNYIGQFFSWDGAKGKQPFKELLLAQVIIKKIWRGQKWKASWKRQETKLWFHLKKCNIIILSTN
ncbi:uncharacterized protein [Euwallacea similis]|uniref:uncharacterized protein isoform X2 n=1 Tax=Euwallacea similis TaxID=1736056 RepID=UPI00344C38FA